MSKENLFRHEGPWSDASVVLLCSDTGSWRKNRPVVDADSCIYCGFCYIYCPVQCMEDQGDSFAPNLDFCKGCGICAQECPKKVIAMISEGEFK